jgi:hypothetical protein
MPRQTNPYRVDLFASFVSSALLAATFPMTLYETASARLDPLRLVLSW